LPRHFSIPNFIAKMVVGHEFGAWRVLRVVKRERKDGHPYLDCRCVCGVIRWVGQLDLISGGTKHCGCLDDLFAKRKQPVKQTLQSLHPKEHTAWKNIRQRCFNSKGNHFANYGGRGITVCDRWKNSFKAFFEDMGPSPGPEFSVDRINVNGNYEPTNCQWALAHEQARNKRAIRKLVWRGIALTYAHWSSLTGIPANLICYRVSLGWDAHKVLSTPKSKTASRVAAKELAEEKRAARKKKKLEAEIARGRRGRVWPPRILRHKPSNQARVRLKGKDYYLGEYGSEEAEKNYIRFLTDHRPDGPYQEREPQFWVI